MAAVTTEGSFARLRKSVRPVRPTASSPCLERGEIGLDGRPASLTRSELRSFRLSRCASTVVAAAGLFLIFLVSFGVYAARESAVTRVREYVGGLDVTEACQPVRSEWMNAVYLRDQAVTMTGARVVSKGAETVKTVEAIETTACPEKKIRRVRHTAVTLAFVPLERWPWGGETFLTLRDDDAVCAQHALEMLESKRPCELE